MTQSMENAIAIVGMACRLPLGDTPEALWSALASGQEAVQFYSDEQLLANGVSPEQLADPTYVKATIPLPRRQHFDARFFGIAPREASLMDPQQRLLLETAYHAFERAGYAPDQCVVETGVFVGADISSYYIRNLLHNAQLGADPVQLLYGNSGNATQIAYKLNLKGPALDINTACSTSLVAIHQACRSLLMYECDMALAGGASVQAADPLGYQYRPDSILSPDGHCRAFDQHACGTVPGQGVALVLLKRLDDALRDADRIEAIICGSAINNDGAGKVGYTAPSVNGQVTVLHRALAMAGVRAEQVGYVECHGTGTALGDPIELTALNEVYGGPERDTTAPCYLGSLKSNLGHLNSAAGAAGLIKAVLCLQHRQLPASLNFTCLTDKVTLQGLAVNDRLRTWSPSDQPLRAAVSSFGIGGTNAHVVLQAVPLASATNAVAEGPWLLGLSAKSSDALARKQTQLADFLRDCPDARLEDVCFTSNTGRSEYVYRHALVVGERGSCIAQLRHPAPARLAAPAPSDLLLVLRDNPELLVRGHALLTECPAFALAIHALAPSLPLPLYLDKPTLNPTQLRILRFAVLHALVGVWLGWGLQPRQILCDTLGELVAACHAGCLSLVEAVQLIQEPASEIGERRGSERLSWLSSLDGEPVRSTRVFAADYWQQPRSPDVFLHALDSQARATGRCLLDAAALPWPLPASAACIVTDAVTNAVTQLLQAVAELWQRGVPLNLAAVHGVRGQRLVLPGYPFDSVRHWVDAAQVPTHAALAQPEATGTCIDAGSELEHEIASLWCQLLGVERISVTDDFFELGGHSLLATQLNARIHQLFGIQLSLDDLFDHPTVQATVALMLRHEGAALDASL